MAKKIRDITVKVCEYQDRNTGETKGRWLNVGSLMKNDDDNSLFIVLERTFSPAGVPNPENRNSVILSCFVPQDRQQGGNGGQQSGQGNNGYGGGNPQQGNHGGDYGGQSQGGQNNQQLDDEIPF